MTETAPPLSSQALQNLDPKSRLNHAMSLLLGTPPLYTPGLPLGAKAGGSGLEDHVKLPETFQKRSETFPNGFRKVGIASTLCFCYVNLSGTFPESSGSV